MFTDAACGTGPVGRDRRGFLKELGLGSIALASLVEDQKGERRRGLAGGRSRRPARSPAAAHHSQGKERHLPVHGRRRQPDRDVRSQAAAEKSTAEKRPRTSSPKEDLDGLNPSKTFYTSQIVPPVFSFKRYGQSGAWVSEIFPHLTKVVDDITFIKSMYADVPIHGPGQILMHTGYSRQGPPQSRLLGDLRAGGRRTGTCRDSW